MSSSLPALSPRRWLLLLLLVSGSLLGGSLLGGCRRQPPASPAAAVKLLVEADGVYRVSLADLRAGGLAVDSLDVANLRLTTAGEPVPYQIEDDALVFYGQAPASRYLAARPYILETGAAGVTMQVANVAEPGSATGAAVTRSRRLEENWEYVSDAQVAGGHAPWFWQTIQFQGEVTVDFVLPPLDDGSGQLTVALYGSTHNQATNPDHSLTVHLNEQTVETVTWEGQVYYTTTLALPAGTLREGENRLVLENAPEDYVDIMRLDWLEVSYRATPTAGDEARIAFSGSGETIHLQGFDAPPLILDVTEPDAPLLLVGWQEEKDGARLRTAAGRQLVAIGNGGYRKPAQIIPLRESKWAAATQQADLIILTTDALAPALAPLVEAREAQGISVALVPVEEIYDSFGYGAASPESINAFLAHAVETWTAPSPRYLLLVGDATTDYRGYLAGRPENPVAPPENIIPPYLVDVNFSGETVSDARLADVDGDLAPDLAVGRWPVDTPAAVESLVARTLAYEGGVASERALFAADGTSNEFQLLSERLVQRSEVTGEILSGPSAAEVASFWNEGAWLVTYTGHGSLKLWGKDDVFSIDSVGALSGEGATPIVLQLTCLSGLFAHPEIDSLSEAMLTHEGGPVLTVAATSLTLSSHQEPFAVRFLQALRDPQMERVGDALQAAKGSLDLSNPGLREISDTFGLLGDPSALIVRPAGG